MVLSMKIFGREYGLRDLLGVMVLVVLFSFALYFYETFSENRTNITLSSVRKTISDMMWEYDINGIRRMADFMIKSGFAVEVSVFDEYGKNVLHVCDYSYLPWIDRALYKLGLLREEEVDYPLIHQDVYVGGLALRLSTERFYVYVLNFLLFIVSVALWLQRRRLVRITDRLKKALADLKRSEEMLINAEKLASLGRLVADISHSLNTPLGVIYTSASHLKTELRDLERLYNEGKLTEVRFVRFLEDTKELIDIITSNVSRVSELVRSLKKVSAHGVSEVRAKVVLCEYLEEIVRSLRPVVVKRGHSIDMVCECKGLEITTVPGALTQIITNLVENSLHHGFKGVSNGVIRIKVSEEGPKVKVVYEDNGVGLTEEVRKRLFEPFFTTDQSGERTGMGMNLVYNLVKSVLRGEIEVYSEGPGKGVRFVITFPKWVWED